MGEKSYWFEGKQKGNFSNDGKDTFDPSKGYIGIRLQQGVPLLDRDWNELEDIRRDQEMNLRRYYIGNCAIESGFKIIPTVPPSNDFKIMAGRCMVSGFEAVNYKDILYSDQRDPDTGQPLPDPIGIRAYLDVWIREMQGTDDLKNKQDVKIETCVRHKVEWLVKTSDAPVRPSLGHYIFFLGYLTIKDQKIEAASDRRRIPLLKALSVNPDSDDVSASGNLFANGKICIRTRNPGNFSLAISGVDSDEERLNGINISSDKTLKGETRLNLIKFGVDGDYQILHNREGVLGRNTLGLNCDTTDAISISSSGLSLLEVEGGTGNVYIKGRIGLGTSEIGNFRLNIPGIVGNEWLNGIYISSDKTIKSERKLNLIKFGADGDYQILHNNRGKWGRPTLGLHCGASDAIGIYSTGWNPLLEVEGDTGNVYIKGNAEFGESEKGGFRLRIPCAAGGNEGVNGIIISADRSLRGGLKQNLIKFGQDGNYQILHNNRGLLGRNTLALNCDAADAIGIYSNGTFSLLEVEGGTGNVFIRGKIDVLGNIDARGQINSAELNVFGNIKAGGNIIATGNVIAKNFPASDLRFKSNIMPFTHALDSLMKMRGVYFEWNDLYRSKGYSVNGREIGLIAQEVETIVPELVCKWGDENYRGIDYARLTVVLVEAIKELKMENDAIKRTIQGLQEALSKR